MVVSLGLDSWHVMDTLIGMGVAIGGSCLFGIGAALQALEARAVPQEHALRASLLRRLLARPRWLAGSLIAGLSWPIHAAALTLAPLAVVQAADSVGLIVLARGRRARARGESGTARVACRRRDRRRSGNARMGRTRAERRSRVGG